MITRRKKFIVVFFPLINVELQEQKADIFHDSDKLVIARLSHTIWPIFSSFLIFCCYFNRVKAREISQQNMRNSKNIGPIVLETVQKLMLIFVSYWKRRKTSGKLDWEILHSMIHTLFHT